MKIGLLVVAALSLGLYLGVRFGIIDIDALRSLFDDAVVVKEVKIG